MHAGHYRRLIVLQLRIVRQVLRKVPKQACGRSHTADEEDGACREQDAKEAEHEPHDQVVPSCAWLQASSVTENPRTARHFITARPPPPLPRLRTAADPCGCPVLC